MVLALLALVGSLLTVRQPLPRYPACRPGDAKAVCASYAP